MNHPIKSWVISCFLKSIQAVSVPHSIKLNFDLWQVGKTLINDVSQIHLNILSHIFNFWFCHIYNITKLYFTYTGRVLCWNRWWYKAFFVFWIQWVSKTMVIYDRVGNKKNNFEITAFLNYKRGTSRAGNSKSNENKNVPHSSAERREFQNNFSSSVPYHI